MKNDPKKVYNLIKYHIYKLELIDMSKFIYQLAATMYNSKTWTDHLSQLCKPDYYPTTDLKPFALDLSQFFVALFSVHNIRNSDALE